MPETLGSKDLAGRVGGREAARSTLAELVHRISERTKKRWHVPKNHSISAFTSKGNSSDGARWR